MTPLPDDQTHLEQAQVDEGREDRPLVMMMSRNPSVTLCEVSYRGCKVPYIEVFRVPVDEDGQQVYPFTNLAGESTDEAQSLVEPYVVQPHPGPWRWSLVLDGRLSWDFSSREEVSWTVGMIADAMAVATGWASHGSVHRLNQHGPVTVERESE